MSSHCFLSSSPPHLFIRASRGGGEGEEKGRFVDEFQTDAKFPKVREREKKTRKKMNERNKDEKKEAKTTERIEFHKRKGKKKKKKKKEQKIYISINLMTNVKRYFSGV